ncbi:MAG: DUF5654 family protein [Candidatus Pacearchaeota archaeon]|nr:DUF5654 family protein [Candidatus Pacearchaeota archaeon]
MKNREEIKEKIKEKAKELKEHIKEKIATLVVSAFGFVAALQWNNWVQAVMKPVIEKGGKNHFWLLLIAIFVTIIAVLIAYLFGKKAK